MIDLPEFPKFDTGNIHPILPNIELLDKDMPYLAKAYYEKLSQYIIDFEKNLNEEEEIGAKLVSFGETIIIHIDDIGYWNPRLISFEGRDNSNNTVQLIQHVNQISILLMKVKRVNTESIRVGNKLKQALESNQ